MDDVPHLTTVRPAPDDAPGVVIVDVRMPFWSMVALMVRWAIASVPAAMILTVLVGALWTLQLSTCAAVAGPKDETPAWLRKR